MFEEVDTRASPLTEELYRTIEARQKELNEIAERDRENRKRFIATPHVRSWEGLLKVGRSAADTRQREKFLKEWFDTIQVLRDIGSRISFDVNRPKWLSADIPSGAQADQFLHAHYYEQVIDEQGRSRFADHYETNKRDPEQALRKAIAWWKNLPSAPNNEDRTLYEWAPVLRDALANDRVLRLSETEFEGVCERVWSIQDHGRRVRNETLNLPDGQPHPMPVKTKALAKYLFGRRSPNGATVLETLYYVLYGGDIEDVPLRLWDATGDRPWRIEHLGVSALGEIVGWALPDRFPPRNNRTNKSLRSLGYNVRAVD